jgi:hypothetical protein
MIAGAKYLILGAVAVAATIAIVVGMNSNQAARGDVPAAAGGTAGRYSVVDTEGHNLIVTDNKTNTLYFYTIDKDAEIGSDLKLRGSVNLNDVGKAVIHPTVTKKKTE